MCQTEKKTKVSFAALSGPRLVICHSSSDIQRRRNKLGTCVSSRQSQQRLQTSRQRLMSPGTGRSASVCVLCRWAATNPETPASTSPAPSSLQTHTPAVRRCLSERYCFKSSKSQPIIILKHIIQKIQKIIIFVFWQRCYNFLLYHAQQLCMYRHFYIAFPSLPTSCFFSCICVWFGHLC